MSQNRKSQEGFSIIEILITLFIVVVMLMLYQTALDSVFLTKNSSDESIALRIANHEMESLREAGYANLPASGTFSDSLLSTIPSGTATMTISTYNAKTKQADVTVTWQERNTSDTHSVTVTTLITQTGGL